MKLIHQPFIYRFSFLALFLTCHVFSFAQFNMPDSLLIKIDEQRAKKEEPHRDSTLCSLLCEVLKYERDEAKFASYVNELLGISTKRTKDSSGKQFSVFREFYAAALTFQSDLADKSDKNEEAIALLEKSQKIYQELGKKNQVAVLHGHLAAFARKQGNISKSLRLLSDALRIFEELNDKKQTAVMINRIGFIYKQQGDIDKAMEYYQRSLKLFEEVGDKSGIAQLMNGIGLIYMDKKDIENALNYLNKSLEIRTNINDKRGMANSYHSIAGVHVFQKEYAKAVELYTKSLTLSDQNKDKLAMVKTLNSLSMLWKKMNDKKKSFESAQKSLIIAQQTRDPDLISGAAQTLYQICKWKNDDQSALKHFELYIQMKDSITNQNNKKAVIRSQLKYEYEKQAAADSVAHAKESEIKNAELAKQTAEIKAKKNQQYALFGGLALVMIFAGFIYNRFKITQKQKTIIEHQKEVVEEQKALVEEKQKEILDSIHYARRIQMAQIPSEKSIYNILKKVKKQ